MKNAQKYFDELNAAGFRPDSRMFSCFIAAFCRKKNLDGALSQLHCLVHQYQLQPETCAVECLVEACCCSKQGGQGATIEQLATLMDELRQIKVSLNYHFVLMIIDKFCKDFQRPDLAKDVPKCFKIDGTSTSYKEIVIHFCKLGHFRAVVELVGDLHASQLSWKTSDYETLFEVVLKSCSGSSPQHAEEFLKDLRDVDVVPTSRMYRMLLRRYEQLGMLADAKRILEFMNQEGLHAGDNNNRLLISGPQEGTCSIFENDTAGAASCDDLSFSTLEERCDPSTPAQFHSLLISLEQNLRNSRALCHQAVAKLIQQGKVEQAEMVMNLLEKKQAEMAKIAFNRFLEGHCKERDVNKVERVLFQMEDCGVELEHRNYHRLIQCYCESGFLDRALRVVQVCEMSGESKLSVSTYNIILKEYCKRGAVLESLAIFSKLKRLGLKANFDTVRIMLEMCCVRGLESEIETVFQMLYSEGVPLDVESCNLCFEAFPQKEWHNFKFMPRIAGEDEVRLQRQKDMNDASPVRDDEKQKKNSKMQWRNLFQ
eukprot:TRINITY_DN2790_c0_g1_i1.p1 TRINITY_DN2790_c0_g1~~TRINITY_DN2790_c0_g1_i1.p1  ORF type:complete len:619 (-),score=163.63 TRINITY_DN2790_c0_g1_i1:94-1716(-)